MSWKGRGEERFGSFSEWGHGSFRYSSEPFCKARWQSLGVLEATCPSCSFPALPRSPCIALIRALRAFRLGSPEWWDTMCPSDTYTLSYRDRRRSSGSAGTRTWGRGRGGTCSDPLFSRCDARHPVHAGPRFPVAQCWLLSSAWASCTIIHCGCATSRAMESRLPSCDFPEHSCFLVRRSLSGGPGFEGSRESVRCSRNSRGLRGSSRSERSRDSVSFTRHVPRPGSCCERGFSSESELNSERLLVSRSAPSPAGTGAGTPRGSPGSASARTATPPPRNRRRALPR